MQYAMDFPLVSHASESERAAFIRRTYLHLAGAVLAFVGLETALFTAVSQAGFEGAFARIFASPFSILFIFVAFMGVGYLARAWANSAVSPAMQYAGLGLYVIAEVLIFVPILFVAIHYINDPSLLPTAAILTLSVFGGLTAAAFITRKDFSFLGPILAIAGFIVLGIILCAIALPFFGIGIGLGMWFSVLMIVLASGYILYDTSNIIHHYRTDQHVAAALALFASLATLFYYILRLFCCRDISPCAERGYNLGWIASEPACLGRALSRLPPASHEVSRHAPPCLRRR